MAKRPINTATTSIGDGLPVSDTASLARSREGDAVAAAASAVLDGRPEDASRAAEAAAGSALNAPGVGGGVAAEPFNRQVSDLDPIVAQDGLRLVDVALDRPAVVVPGPAVEVGAAAGLPPAIMSSQGAFGSAPEAEGHLLARRIDAIEGGPRHRSAGHKRAEPLPEDRTNVAELIARGFDLIVTAKHDGFRRAGVGHPSAPTLRRSEDFTVDELKAMDADPMLVVQALR